MASHFRSAARIDLAALAANLRTVKARVAPAQVIAVVKANAYGHGAVECARSLGGADWLAVAGLGEALELRAAGIAAPLLTLSPLFPDEDAAAVRAGFTPVIEAIAMAVELDKRARDAGAQVDVHLKIDTGMSRIGAMPDEAVEIAAVIEKMAGVRLSGLCSHFACAESDLESASAQLADFRRVAAQVEAEVGRPLFKHIANSAAAAFLPDSWLDGVRLGCLLYGIIESDMPLQPVLSWNTRVVSLRTVGSGTGISYGATHVTRRSARIATIPVGYADGYLRTLSNRGIVGIRGVEAPVVGRVCMDHAMIDVTGVPGVEIGDQVTLIGGSITVPRIASLAATTVHEIPTVIGERVERIYAD